MKRIRLAVKIIKTLTKDRMRYPGRLLVDTVAIIARCGVVLVLYSYAFRFNGGTINGTIFPVAAWSMFFYFAFSTLFLRDISRMIMQDVQSGNVEVLFNRPISYLAFRSWWQIGSGLYSFAVILPAGALAMALFVGLPQTMTSTLFLSSWLLVFLGGAALSLVLYAIIGLVAFWIEDINPLFWVVDKIVMILGGSYLPVALFPEFMRRLAVWSPFGATQFVTHTVYESWRADWAFLIGMQAFWLFVLCLAMYYLFAKARRKVSINGG